MYHSNVKVFSLVLKWKAFYTYFELRIALCCVFVLKEMCVTLMDNVLVENYKYFFSFSKDFFLQCQYSIHVPQVQFSVVLLFSVLTGRHYWHSCRIQHFRGGQAIKWKGFDPKMRTTKHPDLALNYPIRRKAPCSPGSSETVAILPSSFAGETKQSTVLLRVSI